MQKFCTKCGNALNEETGECPVCSKELTKKELKKQKKNDKKLAKKTAKKEKWAKLSLKEKFKKICIRSLVTILIVAILSTAITCTLVYFNVVNIPVISKIFSTLGINKSDIQIDAILGINTVDNSENQKKLEELDKQIENELANIKNTPVDADSYFQNNSTIVAELDANSSTSTHTEADVYSNLTSRGFLNPIETEYNMSGEYTDTIEISSTSTEKHPMYQSTYITEYGDIWMIIEINGVVMANPVSYNMNSSQGTEIIISETGTVTSYDSRTNKFYETVPNESALIVKTIPRIDAEALENLTYGEINRL